MSDARYNPGASGTLQAMRMEADGKVVSDVLLFLTKTEAAELRDGIEALLANFDASGWHAHVSSPDFQIELTVAPEVPSTQ